MTLYCLIFGIFFGLMTFTGLGASHEGLIRLPMIFFYGVASSFWTLQLLAKIGSFFFRGQALTCAAKDIHKKLQVNH